MVVIKMMEIDFDEFISNGGSDGCSGGLSKTWKLIYGKYPPFQNCCQIHDYNYQIGGNADDRWAADIELFKCIHEYNVFWAYVAFFAVRIFGSLDMFWHWRHYEYKI